MVAETPEVYAAHVRPLMQRKREEGRLNWVWNIIDGKTEQEDVILRDHGSKGADDEGFLMLPDLNWDRKTMTSLHLLGIVERRDIWSLRDLKKKHVGWLKHIREQLLDATVKLYPGMEKDMLKLYVHCMCLVPSLPTKATNNGQISQLTTISTSMLCTPCSKPAVPKPPAKPLDWKT